MELPRFRGPRSGGCKTDIGITPETHVSLATSCWSGVAIDPSFANTALGAAFADLEIKTFPISMHTRLCGLHSPIRKALASFAIGNLGAVGVRRKAPWPTSVPTLYPRIVANDRGRVNQHRGEMMQRKHCGTWCFVIYRGRWRTTADVRLAEGVGFEPTIRLPVYTLSKRAPSATRPSLRRGPCHDGAGAVFQVIRGARL